MNLTFYPRGGVLQCRINTGKRGDSFRMSTGIKLKENHKWDLSKQIFSGKDTISLRNNAKLSKATSIVKELLANRAPLDEIVHQLKLFFGIVSSRISDDKMYLLNYAQTKQPKVATTENLSEYTNLTYERLIRSYAKFVEETGEDLNLIEIDLSGKAVDERIEIAKAVDEHFNHLKTWMIEQDYKPNTQKNVVTILRRFYRSAAREFMLTLPPIKDPKGEEVPIVTLPQEVYEKILRDEYKLSRSEDTVVRSLWQIATVMLTTSLRVGDIAELSPGNIVFLSSGHAELTRITKKKKKRAQVILPPQVACIIKENIAAHGDLFPVKATVNFIRANLHHLWSKIPELSAPYTVERLTSDRTGIIQVTAPLSQFLTPHSLRKSAITSMIARGVPDRQVKWASGHTGDSKAFEKYVDYVQKKQSESIKQFHDQIYQQKEG
jgi:integrase